LLGTSLPCARGADTLACRSGERAEVREAEPRRDREGAHGGSEVRCGSFVAAAATRASVAAPAAPPSFAFDLFELDEERHPNHAHGDNLAVLDCQMA